MLDCIKDAKDLNCGGLKGGFREKIWTIGLRMPETKVKMVRKANEGVEKKAEVKGKKE